MHAGARGRAASQEHRGRGASGCCPSYLRAVREPGPQHLLLISNAQQYNTQIFQEDVHADKTRLPAMLRDLGFVKLITMTFVNCLFT